MEIVREELGPDGDFAMDLHWHYDARDAISLAKALEHVNPMWLEDPVPPENPEAMAYVRRESPVPICTGENLYGLHGFQRLIELQALSTACISIFRNRAACWNRNESPISRTCTISGPRRTIRQARSVPLRPRMPRLPCETSAFMSWPSTLNGGRTW